MFQTGVVSILASLFSSKFLPLEFDPTGKTFGYWYIDIGTVPFHPFLPKFSNLGQKRIVVARRVKSYQWAADVVGILMSFRF